MSYEECKVAAQTEAYWIELGGPDYQGVYATPERYYTELTKALLAQTDAQLSEVTRAVERRRWEISILTQEMAEIQNMLAATLGGLIQNRAVDTCDSY